MKLEVGNYVRTKDGIIAKCTEVRINRYMFDRIILENGYYNDWEFIDIPKEKSLIKKASNNIIDLIEVGDYVNGYKISAIYDDDSEVNEYNLKHKKCLGKNIYDEDYQEHLIYEEDIETIVTKEQFESMQYKVD